MDVMESLVKMAKSFPLLNCWEMWSTKLLLKVSDIDILFGLMIGLMYEIAAHF